MTGLVSIFGDKWLPTTVPWGQQMQYYQQPHQIQHRSYNVFLDITTLQLYRNKTKKTSKNNNAVQIFQIKIIYFVDA